MDLSEVNSLQRISLPDECKNGSEILKLSLKYVSQRHLQAALTVLTRGLADKGMYLMRVTSGDEDSWNQLEAAL